MELFRKKELQSVTGWNKVIAVVVTVLCISSSAGSSLAKVRECGWLYRENPLDDSSYFQCLHGEPILQRCARNLVWNAEGSYCDWKSRSLSKDSQKNKGTPAKGGASTNSMAKLDGFLGAVRSCPTGTYAPVDGDCSKYTICTNGLTYPMQCSGGLYWDTQISTCNWPSDTSCGASGTSQPASDTAPAPAPPPPAAAPAAIQQKPETLPPFIPPQGGSSIGTSSVSTTTKPPTFLTTTTSSPTLPPSSYKVVCYYTNWANYRPGAGRYTPANIDSTLCTHIIYAFAVMNPNTFKLEMFDPWVDAKDGLGHIAAVTKLRAKGTKVLIAVGGWNDSNDIKWSNLFKDPVKMQTFIESCYEFVNTHGFDGIDLDYEYPGCPQANCNPDSDFEKQAFITLVVGLRQKFTWKYLITAAVSCNEMIMRQAYEVSTLAKYLDFFNVMTYDYHGSWEKIIGINAPLYQQSDNDRIHLNVYYSLRKYIELNAPSEKIVMGIPMYGQNFQLADTSNTAVGAAARGPGTAGPFTRQRGFLAYYEICSNKNLTIVQDPTQRFGHYGYSGDQWVSFDDTSIIQKKIDVIKDLKLGGAMIWALDLDDFDNSCGTGKYPLLTAINKGLRGTRGKLQKKKSSSRGWTRY